MNTKGVFCVEGDWSSDLEKPSSVHPILLLLRERLGVPFIYLPHVNTTAQLEKDLSKWTQKKYADYPILYLAYHGKGDRLTIDREGVDLDWFAEKLRGKCEARIIHFGSCGTMGIHGNRINRFLEQTGALAVSGYTTDVDWLVSAAFELLFFAEMQGNVFFVSGAKAIRKRIMSMRGETGQLAKRLNFRMVIRPPTG